jgi:acyl-[acyl-carrier-protein]-phospholipid O-acyltransferase / long-chain-fatty-acid--[acyl-carrier-protein] ligase
VSPILGFVTDPSGFEWLDLAVPFIAFFFYLALCYLFPRAFLRPLWWLITRCHYRMRVFNAARFPKTGGVLVVSNHVSYVDWMLLWMACPRRVRFIAAASHSNNPFLKFCLRVGNTIPVDGRSGPKAMIRSMKGIAEALDRGEVICVFPEGKLTRTSNMANFSRGLEKILEFTQTAVPIVPVHIHGMWGSIFSYRYGKLFFKWPEKFFRRTAVTWGEPLPKDTKAPEVRLKIQHLSAEAAIRQSDYLLPVHREFVREGARFRQLFRPAFVDTTGLTPRKVSYLKALVGAMIIRKWLQSRIGEEQNVGVWLPASVGSALTNVALAFLGRTSVNLNYTAGIEAVKSAAQQTGMKTVITSKRFLEKMPLDLGEGIKLIDLEEARAGTSKFQQIRTLLAVLLLPGWFLDRFVLGLSRAKLDDVITIIFSSGSTGDPKGVMLTQRNIAGNADSMITQIALSKSDRILGILPLFHSFGYTVTFWTPLLIGASTVFHADPRQAKKVGELCRTQGCTIVLGTATFLRLYLRGCQPEDFKTARLIVCGAEKLPPSLEKHYPDRQQGRHHRPPDARHRRQDRRPRDHASTARRQGGAVAGEGAERDGRLPEQAGDDAERRPRRLVRHRRHGLHRRGRLHHAHRQAVPLRQDRR